MIFKSFIATFDTNYFSYYSYQTQLMLESIGTLSEQVLLIFSSKGVASEWCIVLHSAQAKLLINVDSPN